MHKDVRLVKNNVCLRPYRPDDADIVYEAVVESIPQLEPWMSWAHPGYTIGESIDWLRLCEETWANGSEYEFAIEDAQTGLYLGGCGLNKIRKEDNTANLGYWVRTGQTKKGIASTATLLLARWGFETLGLQRIEIVIAVENTASRRVAEKAGAAREGILRNRLRLHDVPRDAVMYSFIPGDFLKK